jgi:hypothetical protein
MALAKALRTAERGAKKARRQTFERRKIQALVFEYEAALIAVEALARPVVTAAVEHRADGDVLVFQMGDTNVWHLRSWIEPDDREERMRALDRAWRDRRLVERGIGHAHRMAVRQIDVMMTQRVRHAAT